MPQAQRNLSLPARLNVVGTINESDEEEGGGNSDEDERRDQHGGAVSSSGAGVVSKKPFSLIGTQHEGAGEGSGAQGERNSTPSVTRTSPTMSDVSSVTAASGTGLASHSTQQTSSHQQSVTSSLPNPQNINQQLGGVNRPSNPNTAPGLFQDNSPSRPLVRIMFDKYDKNKVGLVHMAELQELCYDCGTYLPIADLRTAVRNIDSSGKDALSYEEFMVWWRMNDKFRYISPPPFNYVKCFVII